MKKTIFLITVSFILSYFIIIVPSCTFDAIAPPEVEEFCDTLNVTYTNQIKAIVDTKCAFTNCHVSGFSSGDFSTYNNMLSRLESGLIERRAIQLKNMPPSDFPQLSTEELDVLSCWLSKGFPEN